MEVGQSSNPVLRCSRLKLKLNTFLGQWNVVIVRQLRQIRHLLSIEFGRLVLRRCLGGRGWSRGAFGLALAGSRFGLLEGGSWVLTVSRTWARAWGGALASDPKLGRVWALLPWANMARGWSDARRRGLRLCRRGRNGRRRRWGEPTQGGSGRLRVVRHLRLANIMAGPLEVILHAVAGGKERKLSHLVLAFAESTAQVAWVVRREC